MRRIDFPLFDELEPVFDLAFLAPWVDPIQVGNLVYWANVFFRISMAVQAPAHAKRLVMGDDLHLVHISVALYARNAAIYVNRVIEVNVVRRFMYPYPWYRFSGSEACAHWLEQGAICLDRAVARHAGTRRRYVGMP